MSIIGTPPFPDRFEQDCAREEAESTQRAYVAFRETEPCHRCGEGESWTVKGPDGACIGQSWTGDDAECDAEESAQALNAAFELGSSFLHTANARVSDLEKLLADAKRMAEFGDINEDMEDDGIGWKQWYVDVSEILASQSAKASES